MLKQVKNCQVDVDPGAVSEASSVWYFQAATGVGINAGMFDQETCFFPSLSDGEQYAFLWFLWVGELCPQGEGWGGSAPPRDSEPSHLPSAMRRLDTGLLAL